MLTEICPFAATYCKKIIMSSRITGLLSSTTHTCQMTCMQKLPRTCNSDPGCTFQRQQTNNRHVLHANVVCTLTFWFLAIKDNEPQTNFRIITSANTQHPITRQHESFFHATNTTETSDWVHIDIHHHLHGNSFIKTNRDNMVTYIT